MTSDRASPLIGDLRATWNSHYAENLFEHVFIAEVLQECAFVRKQRVEVLRAEVDESGYDLVLSLGKVTRHIQLKASAKGGSTKSVTVNDALQEHIGGCVVWMLWTEGEDHRCEFAYRFFGHTFNVSEAKPLPAKTAKHQRTKEPKPKMRVITPGQFESVSTTRGLVELLFGPPMTSPSSPTAKDEESSVMSEESKDGNQAHRGPPLKELPG